MIYEFGWNYVVALFEREVELDLKFSLYLHYPNI